MAELEYRVAWAASSNYHFRGATDWTPWIGDATHSEIEAELGRADAGVFPQGLEEVLEASGFDWWVETRDPVSDGQVE